MSKPTQEIDQLIREALGQADAELHEQFGEQTMLERAMETFFSGRQKLFVFLTMAVTLVLMVLGIMAALSFVRAQETRDMLLAGAGAALCFGMIGGIKIWSWLELTRVAVARDVKRLELQIAQLAAKLPSA